MPKKPAIFFCVSFIISFILGSLASPALARAAFAFRPEPHTGFFFADAKITASPKLIQIQMNSPLPSPVPRISPIPSHSIIVKPVVIDSHLEDETDFIMTALNNYRKSKELTSVKTNSETCTFAKTRAGEISQNFDHNGFTSRVNSKTLPYQSYHLVTENIAETTNYKQVVDMWIASAGHRENMQKDTPFVCVEKKGNYYAYEGWKP